MAEKVASDAGRMRHENRRSLDSGDRACRMTEGDAGRLDRNHYDRFTASEAANVYREDVRHISGPRL
jgi:hypothetical protein